MIYANGYLFIQRHLIRIHNNDVFQFCSHFCCCLPHDHLAIQTLKGLKKKVIQNLETILVMKFFVILVLFLPSMWISAILCFFSRIKIRKQDKSAQILRSITSSYFDFFEAVGNKKKCSVKQLKKCSSKTQMYYFSIPSPKSNLNQDCSTHKIHFTHASKYDTMVFIYRVLMCFTNCGNQHQYFINCKQYI